MKNKMYVYVVNKEPKTTMEVFKILLEELYNNERIVWDGFWAEENNDISKLEATIDFQEFIVGNIGPTITAVRPSFIFFDVENETITVKQYKYVIETTEEKKLIDTIKLILDE